MRDTLFKPVRLGALELPNSIVMSAMTRSRANAADEPSDLHVDYYSQRASAGMIVTEGAQPSADGKGYCRTPGIYTQGQIEGWARVADAVHARGALIVMQIMHTGRVASLLNKPDGSGIVAPSAVPCNAKIFTEQAGFTDMDPARALSLAEIEEVIGQYRQAALNARAAGMDGVELHCSSGYLPMQFLSSNTNLRDDRYGGSVENRLRFALECLQAMGDAIGMDRVGLRVCPGFDYNDIHDANPAETYGLLMEKASEMGLAYLHLVRRSFGDLDNFALVKKHWRGNLILNNELTAETAAEALHQGAAEAISFGRDFIANPDLVERLDQGLALSSYNPSSLYTEGPAGFTDYPRAV